MLYNLFNALQLILKRSHIFYLILLLLGFHTGKVESGTAVRKVGSLMYKTGDAIASGSEKLINVRNRILKKIPGVNLGKKLGRKLMNIPILKQIGAAVKPLVQLGVRLDPLHQIKESSSRMSMFGRGQFKDGIKSGIGQVSDWVKAGTIALSGGTELAAGIAKDAATNMVVDGIKKILHSKSRNELEQEESQNPPMRMQSPQFNNRYIQEQNPNRIPISRYDRLSESSDTLNQRKFLYQDYRNQKEPNPYEIPQERTHERHERENEYPNRNDYQRNYETSSMNQYNQVYH